MIEKLRKGLINKGRKNTLLQLPEPELLIGIFHQIPPNIKDLSLNSPDTSIKSSVNFQGQASFISLTVDQMHYCKI
jgi:hypothetical protein